MKLKHFLFFIIISLFSSLVGNLYTNMKINELSKNLSVINEDVIELQIRKDPLYKINDPMDSSVLKWWEL